MTIPDSTKKIANNVSTNCQNNNINANPSSNNTSLNLPNQGFKNNSIESGKYFESVNLFAKAPTFATISGFDAKGEPNRYIGQLPKETITSLLKFTHSHKKTIVHSGMNSGKTYFIDKNLIDYYKALYPENLHIIYTSPRKLLTGQAANDLKNHGVIQYSSNRTGKKEDFGNPISKFKKLSLSESNSVSITTFSGIGEIVSLIKEYKANAVILVVIDEIHEVINGASYMDLAVLERFIENGDINFVCGFTATPNHSFIEKGYKIAKIERDFKPKRTLEVRSFYEGSKYNIKKRKALQDMVNVIIERGYKTTLTIIDNKTDMQTFKEMLGNALNNHSIVYSINGDSTEKERDANKFLAEIQKNNYPLIGSHLIMNKVLDVGINIKQDDKIKDYLDAILLFGDSDNSVVNPFTARQAPARARSFKSLPIILFIPDFSYKHINKPNFNINYSEARRLCYDKNKEYSDHLIQNHTKESQDEFNKYLHNAKKIGLLRYIKFNRFEKKLMVSKDSIYAEIDRAKGAAMELNELIHYFKEDYNLTLNLSKELSLAIEEKALAIERKNKEQLKRDFETVLSRCLDITDFEVLADCAIDNLADQRMQGALKKRFGISSDFAFSIQNNPKYKDSIDMIYGDKGLVKIEVLAALIPLAKSLINYDNLFKSLCSNKEGKINPKLADKYQYLCFEAAKSFKKAKIDFLLSRLQYGTIETYVLANGLPRFKATQEINSHVADEFIFQRDIKKWIISKGILGKKIFSKSLFHEYKERKQNPSIKYPLEIKSPTVFIKYIKSFFYCDDTATIDKERCIILNDIKTFEKSEKADGKTGDKNRKKTVDSLRFLDIFEYDLKQALNGAKTTELENPKNKNTVLGYKKVNTNVLLDSKKIVSLKAHSEKEEAIKKHNKEVAGFEELAKEIAEEKALKIIVLGKKVSAKSIAHQNASYKEIKNLNKEEKTKIKKIAKSNESVFGKELFNTKQS